MDLKYYWINIDKATKRSDFMKLQFKIHNIKNERISAITPETLPEVLEDKPPYFCGYPDCRNNNCKDCIVEYATLCSHFEAIKAGYKSGAEYFIVCEDDIYFTFKLNFDLMIKNRPQDYDIIQMMVISSGHTEYFYEKFYKSDILLINYNPITPSAGFYLITHKGAEKLLNLYTNKQTNKYDFSNCQFLKLADVLIFQSSKTCVSTLPLCFPNIHFKSQIHEEHYENHKLAYEMIRTKIKEDNMKHPFIMDYYPFEDFEKLFKS
jgi:GR25 family glycosyltransferase involved in LPS biosynthesis